MLQKIVDISKFVYEFHCRLLTDPWTSGEVVGTVSHQREQVYDLCRFLYAILFLYLFLANDVISSAVSWPVHIYIRLDELPIVFVGCEHESIDSIGSSLSGYSANDIVCLIAVDL